MEKEDITKYGNELESWFNSDESLRNSGPDERRKGQFDVIGWLIRQNEYAKYAEKGNLSFNVKAGEIYEVDFGINVNAEFSYRHYALVLADSNENNPLVLVCPLKSNYRGAHPSSDINLGIIKALDSNHESLAVINQIRTIDKLRIFKKPIIKRNLRDRNVLNDSVRKDNKTDFEQVYRLEHTKFQKVIWKTLDFIEYGYFTQK